MQFPQGMRLHVAFAAQFRRAVAFQMSIVIEKLPAHLHVYRMLHNISRGARLLAAHQVGLDKVPNRLCALLQLGVRETVRPRHFHNQAQIAGGRLVGSRSRLVGDLNMIFAIIVFGRHKVEKAGDRNKVAFFQVQAIGKCRDSLILKVRVVVFGARRVRQRHQAGQCRLLGCGELRGRDYAGLDRPALLAGRGACSRKKADAEYADN